MTSAGMVSIRLPSARPKRSTRCRTSAGMSLAPLAQRRQRDRKHVQAVVEIAAEPAAADFLGRSRLVAAMTRTSTSTMRGLPSRSTWPSCSTRSSLRLELERQLADLVEEDGAAVRQLEAADLAGVRAGEGAALVAEQLALDQRRRQRGAVDDDERRVAARAAPVDRAREQLLAGAGLAAAAAPSRRSRATWSTRNIT